MKNFKLLLKNSFKSFWKSRVLVTQFTALTTIATIVVSSVFLGNFSLRNSISEIEDKSNLSGFSIKKEKVEDFAFYNVVKESNDLVTSIDSLTMNDAIGQTKIYNPLAVDIQLDANNLTYGLFGKYINNNYTTSPVSNDWKNIVFANNESDALSIIIQLMNANKYKDRLSDVFTFYNDILPPSTKIVEQSKYSAFFDPSIYCFNPWSFTYKDANNTDIAINNFGIAKILNFEEKYTDKILLNHGVYDSLYSYIVGTDFSILEKEEFDKNKQEINIVNKEVKFASQKNNYFSNNWKQQSSIKEFLSQKDFLDSTWNQWTLYNNNYYQFLNSLSEIIKTQLMVNSKYFSFNYKIDTENSEGISKFFSDMYNNPENEFKDQFNNIFLQNDLKYFEGKIQIPLIPFITVLPNIKNANDWTLNQYKNWALNGFLDTNNSVPNIDNIKEIINDTCNQLSTETNNLFNEKLVSNDVNAIIRNQYYKDYNIEYFINEDLKSDFTLSSNFTLTDSNQNTYIMSKNQYYTDNKVNDIVVDSGINLIKNKIDKTYLTLTKSMSSLYGEWGGVLNWTSDQEIKQHFLNDNVFWSFMNILKQLKINTNEQTEKEYYDLVNKITDLDLFNKEFTTWKSIVKNFIHIYHCSLFAWNGGGFNVEFSRKNNLNIPLDFNGYYYEPSSYASVVSLNYSKIKNGSKQIVNSEFVKKAMNLPFKIQQVTNDELINNLAKYQDNFIYNPYTRKLTFYNDFLDWLNRLDSRFKIDVNGDEFVIIGTGINTEFVYPITSKNQLLINNNAPVVYANELGYDKILKNNTVFENSNYFVNFRNNWDLVGNNHVLNKVNQWTDRVNNKKLAYSIRDSSQPNNLLYLRINFPNTILSTVLKITLIIGSIIILLTFTFIYILMRSIVNQNMNTFAIGMANGISKRKLLFSFMPFVIIPSFISAILGYSFSFLLYPTISNAIQNYWILDYVKFTFNPGYLVLVFLIITLIIFTVQTIVIYIMLNKNVSTLLNTKMEFKYNKLIQHSHKLVSKMSPLASFRITYMLGNIGRLFLLLLMMTSFVSLTTISASSTNTFNAAVQKTMDNKQYNYAIDLVTPTVQGGYYYNIPYNLIGTRQQGLTPLYDFNKTTGFYNKDYKDVLSYKIPNTNEEISYQNILLPQSDIIGDVSNNVTFFRNKVMHLLTMDFGINFLGNYINPYQWAKKLLPNSIINLTEQKLQEQLSYAFLYVYWLQNQKDINTDEKGMWLNNPTSISFIDSFNKSNDPRYWDQSNWLVQLIKKDNKWIWKANEQLISTGLPNYMITKRMSFLLTRILSFDNNPYYKRFINELEREQNKKIIDPSFAIALNIIPFVPNLDETYTYINATSDFNKMNKSFDLKILGIKPNTEHLILWDEYNNKDLKDLLVTNEIEENVYPLIINEVVAKKYGLWINNEIEIIAHNKFNRFITKFENKPNLEKYKFRILGITTSKSEEQFYTTQQVANKILGFTKPKLATDYDLQNGNYDYKWINQKEIDEFIPFNGVFSKQELPKMLLNFATLYSLSGLSPISGTLPTSSNGDAYNQINLNYYKINNILKFNIIDETKQKSFLSIMNFRNDFSKVFGSGRYYTPALAGIDATFASSLLGNIIDDTVGNVNYISMISLLPAILIIIVLMSYMIVVESRRLVALLKVLGFSNWSNTITLSTVQFVVVGLAILLGYGFTAIVLSIMKVFAFNFLNIIINPIIPVWTIGITIGVLALIVTTITLTIFLNLRKTNPAQEIAMR